MSTPADNPFINPALFHPELTENIAAVEAWQEQNSVARTTLVTEGLAKALKTDTQYSAQPSVQRPSMLDILGYFYALRAQGTEFDGNGFIHFDPIDKLAPVMSVRLVVT